MLSSYTRHALYCAYICSHHCYRRGRCHAGLQVEAEPEPPSVNSLCQLAWLLRKCTWHTVSPVCHMHRQVHMQTDNGTDRETAGMLSWDCSAGDQKGQNCIGELCHGMGVFGSWGKSLLEVVRQSLLSATPQLLLPVSCMTPTSCD